MDPTSRPTGAPIDLHEIPLGSGTSDSVTLSPPGAALLSGRGSGTFVSDWYEPDHAFTRLVPSWTAETPAGTWLSIEMQGRRAGGGETRWWSFGTWASGDGDVRRSSVAGQSDGDGTVDVDTFRASVPMSAYRMRLVLSRTPASTATPAVRRLRAVASDASSFAARPPSATALGRRIDLAVPAYSQEIHAGEHPEYDGGGEAWCSPTSTAMVLAFWGTGPTGADLEWVGPGHADPQVDAAARWTYDAAYGGTGNWSFNAAYAARFGLDSFVTQLRSLAEAERFVAAGIPLVASIKVAPGALDGFLLPEGSGGHLLVIRGFTPAGDVIVNDPAAPSDATVRRVYARTQFENAWLAGSGGTVYVIHPSALPLPERPADTTPNW